VTLADDAPGTARAVANGTVDVNGALDLWRSRTGGGWNTTGNWSRGVPTSSLDAAIDLNGHYTVFISSNATARSLTVNDAGATVSDAKGNALTLTGGVAVPGGVPHGALTIDNGLFTLAGGALQAGSIFLGTNGALVVAAGDYTGMNRIAESIGGAGAITVKGSASAEFSGAITGSETFTIKGGASTFIRGPISGTGSFVLMNQANLTFDTADSENVAFMPGSTGTLKIAAPFTGELSGLTPSNSVDLAHLKWAKGQMTATFVGAPAGGTLTVSDGTEAVSLKLLGDYTHASWALSDDGFGGTRVVDPPGSAETDTSDSNAMEDPAPTLAIGSASVFVAAGGSVSLPIDVAGSDSDDHVSLTIAGLPSFETITDGLNDETFAGDSVNLTAAEVESGLTLHSTYTGTAQPVSRLTLFASNTTAGESASSPAQTITVTDPPAPFDTQIGLLGQYMASTFAASGAGDAGILGADPMPVTPQQTFVVPPQHL
jgi:hypothetical protein